MTSDKKDLGSRIKQNPERYLIIHYSSQSLFDEGLAGLSPRITSIVVMHYSTRQTLSFALHVEAESLGVAKEDIESRYNEIEGSLLRRFFDFVALHREKSWIHWNMRN